MIGLFDSGIGGTTIWREIVKMLPQENTLFLADSLYAPYGTRTKEEIIALSKKNTDYLLSQNCHIIVVACNTATTNAISYLRETYKVPFIGIEPAIKPASLNSKTKTIGVLATKGTLSSELFAKTSKNYAENGITIVEQIGEGLVELIENGQLQSREMKHLLEKYLTPMVKKNIDHLVLGCTHYPYLISQIREILPENIQIIDSGEAVARQTKHIMETQKLLNPQENATHTWLTNKNRAILKTFIQADEKVTLQETVF